MLGFGALCEHPLADYGFTGPAAVDLSLPLVALSLAKPVIDVRGGKNLNLPPPALTLGKPVVAVRAGKLLSLPPVASVLTAKTLFVGISAHISLPVTALTQTVPTIAVSKSVNVSLHNSFDLTFALGALGEDALGSYGIADGAPVVLSYRSPLRLTLTSPHLAIQAGKNVNLPPPPVTISVRTPEIGARRRKLRVHVITS